MIDVVNVCKTYTDRKAVTRALRNLNIHIDDGEFVFIMGRSGSGKSSLIRLLLKEAEPSSGFIEVNGQILEKMKRRHVPRYRRSIGCIFQDFRLLKDRTIYENVAFAQRVIGVPTHQIKENVPRVLAMVGLSHKYQAYPNQISGGEQQRAAIARALVNSPKLILADEPTGNLDSKSSREIMRLLQEINDQGTTVIVVTHSHEIVKDMNKRVITMDHGMVISDTGSETVEAFRLERRESDSVWEEEYLEDEFREDGAFDEQDERPVENEHPAEDEHSMEDEHPAEEEHPAEAVYEEYYTEPDDDFLEEVEALEIIDIHEDEEDGESEEEK